jgi:hypothetical protein
LISNGSFEAITDVPQAASTPLDVKKDNLKSWPARFTPFALCGGGIFGHLVKWEKRNCE